MAILSQSLLDPANGEGLPVTVCIFQAQWSKLGDILHLLATWGELRLGPTVALDGTPASPLLHTASKKVLIGQWDGSVDQRACCASRRTSLDSQNP